MPSVIDRVDPVKLAQAAEAIRVSYDVTDMPPMVEFNDAPCSEHVGDGPLPNPYCRHCGIKLRRHQRVAIMWLWLVRNGLIADPTGSGKALPLDAPVLTPSGYRRMGDLQLGDPVVDPDGKPSVVTGVFPQGRKQTYRITFSDGSVAESCEDHLWRVRNASRDRRKDGSVYWQTYTLREIMDRMSSGRSPHYCNWAVPLISDPSDLGSDEELPLDPYVVGALLGDGWLKSQTPHLASADEEVAEQVRRSLPPGAELRRVNTDGRGSAASNYTVCGVYRVIDELDMRHGGEDKFVPERYKLTSVAARLAVLQGLMDTDGSAVPGAAEFGSCSRQLRDDVVWLARSLGFRVTDNGDGTDHSYFNVQHQERREARTRFRARMVAPEGVVPFRLQRKVSVLLSGERRGGPEGLVKWIRAVEPVREEEHQCISVSAESKLFVTQDFTVTHNTHVITGLLSILLETGEIGVPRGTTTQAGRVVVICEPTATRQWQREMYRAVPGLVTELAEGTQRQRSDKYALPWDVLITGHQMFLRDHHRLRDLGVTMLVVDDVDALRHSQTKTANAIMSLGYQNPRCSRVVLLNATPLQKKLPELYDTLTHLGGHEAHRLGTRSEFERRHLSKQPTDIWYVDRHGRTRKRTSMEIIAVRRMPEFQEKIAPMVLRRSLDQIDDVELPALAPPDNVWLEAHPQQRTAYEELQRQVRRLARDGSVKRMDALSKLMMGKKICEGLAVLGQPDGPGTSVKFDWLLNKITGDWSGDGEDVPGEKVVVFVQYKDGIRALASRLEAEGIGYELIWGDERRPKIREASLDRFREDTDCRVLLGTSAMEKSLNLQVARHLVNVDQLPNPARMIQLAGRIRRQGSRFRTVYVHNLLIADTHEERLMTALESEAALASAVWQEESQLFPALTPLQLMSMIDPGTSRSR